MGSKFTIRATKYPCGQYDWIDFQFDTWKEAYSKLRKLQKEGYNIIDFIIRDC